MKAKLAMSQSLIFRKHQGHLKPEIPHQTKILIQDISKHLIETDLVLLKIIYKRIDLGFQVQGLQITD